MRRPARRRRRRPRSSRSMSYRWSRPSSPPPPRQAPAPELLSKGLLPSRLRRAYRSIYELQMSGGVHPQGAIHSSGSNLRRACGIPLLSGSRVHWKSQEERGKTAVLGQGGLQQLAAIDGRPKIQAPVSAPTDLTRVEENRIQKEQSTIWRVSHACSDRYSRGLLPSLSPGRGFLISPGTVLLHAVPGGIYSVAEWLTGPCLSAMTKGLREDKSEDTSWADVKPLLYEQVIKSWCRLLLPR